MLLTLCACNSEKEKVEKMDFGNGNYSLHYFSSDEQRTRYESYKDDVLTEIVYFEYDENNNVIKRTFTDADGNETKRNCYTFENNKLTKETTYVNNVICIEDFYDENDNIYLSKRYDENGNLESYSEGYYDEDGKATHHIYYRADDTIESLVEYSKDANGKHVSLFTYYDENEEMIKQVRKTETANGYKEEILFEK